MSEMLSKDYVLEIIKCALINNRVLEICFKHLKYEYLQTAEQKRVVKYIFDSYSLTGTAPTLGILAQGLGSNKDVIALLSKIKQLNVIGKEDSILSTFQSFIKDIRFQILLKTVADLYNAGKQEEAVKELAKESRLIEDFTIKDNYYIKVFEQYEERMKKRSLQAQDHNKSLLKERLVSGIHDIDKCIRGGFRRGTSFLAMARSGIGKSTFLRWVALCNARLGKRVVFFQAESTEEEALETFDMAWTAATSDHIEDGEIPLEKRAAVQKTRKEILARGGEIILIAAENFDKMSIETADEKLQDIIRIYGPVDMILFDYLEIFTTRGTYGKGESAERRRREEIAEKITGMATRYNAVTGTATQSNDIEPVKVNNPDFKITRHNAAECKGVIKPFSYFFTFNVTEDEYKQEIVRIFMDKVRKHRSGQVIKIYQSRDNARFYDAVKTNTFFADYNYQQIFGDAA